jgi:hypothetical protein
MIDLLILGVSIVLGDFIKGAGSQLMRRVIPSNFDQAQRENVEIRRQELRAQEDRFLKQIAETRKLKMDELETMHRNHQEAQDRAEQLRRWPLRMLPMDVLQRSALLNGTALNMILAVVDCNDADFYKGAGKNINNSIDAMNGYPLHALRDMMHKFSDDVILYNDTIKGSRLSGESLISTVWSMLKTDPTVLVEVNVLSPDRYIFYISHWGGAFDPEGRFVSPIKRLAPLSVDLSSVPPDAVAQRTLALALGLSSVLVSIGDAYRTLQRPHELPVPLFPSLMTNAASASLPDGVWKPMTKAYLATYDGVATHSPAIASELAAKASLVAHAENQRDFAEALLDKALQVHPVLRNATMPDDVIKPILIRQRRQGREPSELENALRTLRGMIVEKGGQNQGVEDRMRAFRPATNLRRG